ncbi:MAG: AAA family ATPase [Clostridia bacterium]|nr:AAA family ATPase [Clostridia bacterium]
MADKDYRIYARIKTIEFINFRNIEYGKVDFPNARIEDFKCGSPSILGLYGQNGSGKTSLIMALSILKDLLSGHSIENNYLSSVRVGCDFARLRFVITLFDDFGVEYEAHYQFDLKTEVENYSLDDNEFNIDPPQDKSETLKVYNEILRYRRTTANGTEDPLQDIIDASVDSSQKAGYSFGNKSKYELLIGKDKEVEQKMRDAKAASYAKSRSFIFSKDVYTSINTNESIAHYKELIAALHTFGMAYLHIINTMNTGINNLKNDIPLCIWSDKNGSLRIAYVLLKTMGANQVPEDFYSFVTEAINGLSGVLGTIVPGLSIEIKDNGLASNEKNETVHVFEIVSNRNGVSIPLKYESDGIRRIVSILSLLIAVYNQPSMTIAIDEMDSGIFEYLLGEILQVLSESARGQLVFSSHNLRPLEVLPAKFLCFTTVNANNRFIKMPDVSANNNLRDKYFRNIILGETEELYAPTDKYDIELAFYQAGNDLDTKG